MLLHVDRLKSRMPKPSGVPNPWLHLALSVSVRFCLRAVAEARRARHRESREHLVVDWGQRPGVAARLVGNLLVIASFITWLYVLRFIPLSIAFPLSRVVDAMVPLSCWIFLGETISARRWIGIALVVIGLAVIARPVARLEERL